MCHTRPVTQKLLAGRALRVRQGLKHRCWLQIYSCSALNLPSLFQSELLSALARTYRIGVTASV